MFFSYCYGFDEEFFILLQKYEKLLEMQNVYWLVLGVTT